MANKGFFHEVYGIWPGHGFGIMLVYEIPYEHISKWVLFRDEDSNKVEILEPALYEIYLNGQEETYNFSSLNKE